MNSSKMCLVSKKEDLKHIRGMSLSDLVCEQSTLNGAVPMGILFDMAVELVYGKQALTELNDMVECYHVDSILVFCSTLNDDTLRLAVTEDLSISFTCNDLPLHFNQYSLYNALRGWGVFPN